MYVIKFQFMYCGHSIHISRYRHPVSQVKGFNHTLVNYVPNAKAVMHSICSSTNLYKSDTFEPNAAVHVTNAI